MDQLVDKLRKKILFFDVSLFDPTKELNEAFLKDLHKFRCQSPHIHGNKALCIQCFCCTIVISCLCAVCCLEDVMCLCNAHKLTILNMAHSSCDASVVT